MKTMVMTGLMVLACVSSALADGAKGEGPCKEVREACEKAGFVKGQAKQGTGLWRDCVDPLMQGTTAKDAKLPLPSVDAKIVADCKAKHPKFGSGKVGM